MILLIDNYDSDMNKLYSLLSQIYADVRVVRGDEVSSERISAFNPDAIIIGSGDIEHNSHICAEGVNPFLGEIPVLGLGLGAEILCRLLGIRTEASAAPAKPVFNVGLDTSCAVFKELPGLVSAEEEITTFINPSIIADTHTVTARDEFGRGLGFKAGADKVFGCFLSPLSLSEDAGEKLLRGFTALIK